MVQSNAVPVNRDEQPNEKHREKNPHRRTSGNAHHNEERERTDLEQ